MWNLENELQPPGKFERILVSIVLLAMAILMFWKGLTPNVQPPEASRQPAFVTSTPIPDLSRTPNLVVKGGN